MPWKPVVVGVDASPASAVAARVGETLAGAMATDCALVHAARDVWLGHQLPGLGADVGPLARQILDLARRDVAAALEDHVSPALVQQLAIHFGAPRDVLIAALATRGSDLLVLGGRHHGQVAWWLGGSTAKKVLRAVGTSVLVATGRAPWVRVLAAVDASEFARPTLAAAERMAALFGASLRVLHGIEPFPYDVEDASLLQPELLGGRAEAVFRERIWPLVQHPGAELVIRRGDAVSCIREEATDWMADLVVVGAHGRGPVERFVVGSVSEGVVNALPASVLVVRGEGPGA